MPTKEFQLIIFLHIVKTAGTSLRWALEAQYPPWQTLDWYWAKGRSLEELAALPAETKRNLRLFSTHYRFGVHEYFEQECTYLSMFREPYRRTISEYWQFHFRRLDDVNNLQQHFDDFAMTLAEHGRDNIQTRFIAGVVKELPVDRSHLEAAKRNLEEKFAAVGLTERYKESLALYARTFNWHTMANVQRNKLKEYKPTDKLTITPTHKQAIIDGNALDADLYEFAVKLFEKQLAEKGITNSVVENTVVEDRIAMTKMMMNRATRRIFNKLAPVA